MGRRKRYREQAHDGKTPYQTQQEAERACDSLEREMGTAFEVYRCQHCWQWHVGHAPGVQLHFRHVRRSLDRQVAALVAAHRGG